MAVLKLLFCLCASVLTTGVTALVLHWIFPNFIFNFSSLVSSIILAISTLFVYHLYTWYLCVGKIKPDNKAVFITGCDSGFGNALAKRLDSKGFVVFAGCQFPDGPGAAELTKCCSGKLKVLYLDVTKDEVVEKAVNFVKQNLGTNELWALVNNAGIYKGISIEFTSTDVFRQVMEVNSIGPVRVTKAFLPLLRNSKGRVINVTSLSGRVTLIGTCAYTMSKYAAVAFTEVLSQEMNVWRIPVISIEPETFRTPMSDKNNLVHIVDENLKTAPEDVLTSYGESYVKKLKQFMINYAGLAPFGMHFVTDAMESAIMDKYPNSSYRPRWNFVTRFVWYFAVAVPYGLAEFVQLKIVYLLGYPVPVAVTKRIS